MADLNTIYVPSSGSTVDQVRKVVSRVLDPEGFDVEEADEYDGYSIAIDLVAIYDATYLREVFQRDLGVPLALESELDPRPLSQLSA